MHWTNNHILYCFAHVHKFIKFCWCFNKHGLQVMYSFLCIRNFRKHIWCESESFSSFETTLSNPHVQVIYVFARLFLNDFSDTESEQLWQFFSVGKSWLDVSSFLKFLIAPDSLTASTGTPPQANVIHIKLPTSDNAATGLTFVRIISLSRPVLAIALRELHSYTL